MNLATIGKLYCEGEVDSFQARAMIELQLEAQGHKGHITERRFQMFLYRWGVWKGSYEAARRGLWWMTQAERKLWHMADTAVVEYEPNLSYDAEWGYQTRGSFIKLRIANRRARRQGVKSNG